MNPLGETSRSPELTKQEKDELKLKSTEEKLLQCKRACRELIRIQGEQARLLNERREDTAVGVYLRVWDYEKYQEIIADMAKEI